MKIAILSWGSLVGSGVERGLRIVGSWNRQGPILPVEFSRISQSGNRQKCLTLVLDEQNGVDVETYYARSLFTNLDLALVNLRRTENITLTYSIGYVNLVRNTERGWARENHPISCDRIKEWAEQNGFDAVIWTSLLSNFEKTLEIPFTVQNAVEYVKSLPEPFKTKAKQYILTSPPTICTPVRSLLMRNWANEQPRPLPISAPAHSTFTHTAEDALMRIVDRFRFHR